MPTALSDPCPHRWWSVFWDIFIARSQKSGDRKPAANTYVEAMRSKREPYTVQFAGMPPSTNMPLPRSLGHPFRQPQQPGLARVASSSAMHMQSGPNGVVAPSVMASAASPAGGMIQQRQMMPPQYQQVAGPQGQQQYMPSPHSQHPQQAQQQRHELQPQHQPPHSQGMPQSSMGPVASGYTGASGLPATHPLQPAQHQGYVNGVGRSMAPQSQAGPPGSQAPPGMGMTSQAGPSQPVMTAMQGMQQMPAGMQQQGGMPQRMQPNGQMFSEGVCTVPLNVYLQHMHDLGLGQRSPESLSDIEQVRASVHAIGVPRSPSAQNAVLQNLRRAGVVPSSNIAQLRIAGGPPQQAMPPQGRMQGRHIQQDPRMAPPTQYNPHAAAQQAHQQSQELMRQQQQRQRELFVQQQQHLQRPGSRAASPASPAYSTSAPSPYHAIAAATPSAQMLPPSSNHTSPAAASFQQGASRAAAQPQKGRAANGKAPKRNNSQIEEPSPRGGKAKRARANGPAATEEEREMGPPDVPTSLDQNAVPPSPRNGAGASAPMGNGGSYTGNMPTPYQPSPSPSAYQSMDQRVDALNHLQIGASAQSRMIAQDPTSVTGATSSAATTSARQAAMADSSKIIQEQLESHHPASISSPGTANGYPPQNGVTTRPSSTAPGSSKFKTAPLPSSGEGSPAKSAAPMQQSASTDQMGDLRVSPSGMTAPDGSMQAQDLGGIKGSFSLDPQGDVNGGDGSLAVDNQYADDMFGDLNLDFSFSQFVDFDGVS